jgi:hypothetical protein
MGVSDNRLDRKHVAEEIEDSGKSQRDGARSQVRRIVEHLLKLAHSPAQPPRFGSIETVRDARQTMSDTISPALRADLQAHLDRLYGDARKRAEASLREYREPAAAAAIPQICPYSLDDICRRDWYPGAGP